MQITRSVAVLVMSKNIILQSLADLSPQGSLLSMQNNQKLALVWCVLSPDWPMPHCDSSICQNSYPMSRWCFPLTLTPCIQAQDTTVIVRAPRRVGASSLCDHMTRFPRRQATSQSEISCHQHILVLHLGCERAHSRDRSFLTHLKPSTIASFLVQQLLGCKGIPACGVSKNLSNVATPIRILLGYQKSLTQGNPRFYSLLAFYKFSGRGSMRKYLRDRATDPLVKVR